MADEERRLVEAAQRGEVENFNALVRLSGRATFSLQRLLSADPQ